MINAYLVVDVECVQWFDFCTESFSLQCVGYFEDSVFNKLFRDRNHLLHSSMNPPLYKDYTSCPFYASTLTHFTYTLFSFYLSDALQEILRSSFCHRSSLTATSLLVTSNQQPTTQSTTLDTLFTIPKTDV